MQKNQKDSSDKLKQVRGKIHAYLFGKNCDVEALFQEGLSLLLNPKNINDWMMARNCLTKVAKQGHVDAQIQLGRMLSSGNPFNGRCYPVRASLWFREAARQGDADGMMELGMMLFAGDGIRQNTVMALQWIEKAAALEHPGALLTLGTFYLRGCYGYYKDTSKGLEMLEKACLKGSVEANFLLGMVYLMEDDVSCNVPLGIEHLKSASQNDFLVANYHLGMLYMTGQLVKQNKQAAAKWFTKSAENGHAPSQYAIGLMLLGGDGVKQDVAAAEDWIRTAYQATEGSGYGV